MWTQEQTKNQQVVVRQESIEELLQEGLAKDKQKKKEEFTVTVRVSTPEKKVKRITISEKEKDPKK